MKTKPQNKKPAKSTGASNLDMRCCCGKLLAKRCENGIVIRCSRCKREIIIEFSNFEMEFT